jgi:hypothetical protein
MSALPILNCLKEGDAILLLIFHVAVEYTIRKIQENLNGLELHGPHQLMVFANSDNILEHRS